MEHPSWKERLKRDREQKDVFLQVHPQSPIPTMERGEFEGLDYYPPKPEYRFELELHKHKERKRVRMTFTGGEKKDFFRWGEFKFKVGGKEQVLQAYKSLLGEEHLFIPFRDATSGKETYSAGRYIDLQPKTHQTKDGKWILDFNRAYNPWCAYNEEYTCPFVPPENWLEVPIPAGEKKPQPRKKRPTTQD